MGKESPGRVVGVDLRVEPALRGADEGCGVVAVPLALAVPSLALAHLHPHGVIAGLDPAICDVATCTGGGESNMPTVSAERVRIPGSRPRMTRSGRRWGLR